MSDERLFQASPFTAPHSFTPEIEGPACDRDGNIYAVSFQTKPTIGRITPAGHGEVFIDMPQGSLANGIRFGPDGAMYVADYTGHNILRIHPSTPSTPSTRHLTVFAHEPSMYQPNDVCIQSNGTIFASDPSWAKSTGRVWRIDRDGSVHRVTEEMGTTNGIEVAPDERTLYVNETVQRNIWAFTIADDGSLLEKRLLIQFPDHGMDGMRCDRDGKLYVTRYGKGAVAILSPRGELLHEVDVLGSRPSNLCFGGPDGRTCYVTEVDHGRLVRFRTDVAGREWRQWG